jgi:hypothetical protein
MRIGAAGLAGAICGLVMMAGAAGAAQRDPVVQAMDAMLDVERRTAAEYERVVRDHGRVAPFPELVEAERGQAEFIEYLYRDRNLPIPANRWSAANARAYRSPAEACAAALESALRVADQYDVYLEGPRELPGDVRRAFRHNRNAAKHVQADRFRACAPGAGGATTAIPRQPRFIPNR